MSIIKIKATIKCLSNSKHPDCKADTPFEYTDTYTVDTDKFYSTTDIYDYIKKDMSLVAGGGYKTDTIKNVKFTTVRI